MSPRRPEQNEARRQETSKKIREAAFDLFAKEGYETTTISAIARKAGVSKGLIYHYFKSKQEILEAIYDSVVDLSDELLWLPEGLTGAEKLKLILSATFTFIEQMTDLARLLMALAIQPEVISGIKHKFDREKEKQLKLTKDILTEMGIDPEQTEAEAFYLGAKLDGIMLGYLTLKDEYPLEQVKQKLFDEYDIS